MRSVVIGRLLVLALALAAVLPAAPVRAEPECTEVLPPNTAVGYRLSVAPGERLHLFAHATSPRSWSAFAGVWILRPDGSVVDGRIAGAINISQGESTIAASSGREQRTDRSAG